MRGICVNSGCNEAVDFGSVEVSGEGFVCSPECEAAVLALVAEYDEFSNL